MKQQERQKKSKEKILQAAITEFSASGYDKVTMENICTRHGISKGMMYHYYSGKDDLFLLCVQNMYQMMQQYLEENMAEFEKKDALHALKEFWMLRESALLRTPPHLFEKIEEIRGPIEALNRQFLHRTIGKIELRENLKKENVSIYLEAMESVFWKLVEQYRREQRISDVHSLMEAAGELWDMVLLGVVRQN